MSKKVLKEEEISLEEVKDLLKQRDEEAPLNYIQRVTLDYAQRFSKDFPHQEEFITKIKDDFEISKVKAIQLINIKAEEINDLNLVLGKDYSKETKEEIFRIYKEHLAMYADEIAEEEELGELDEF